MFKKFEPLSKNSSPYLVSQAGYGLGFNQYFLSFNHWFPVFGATLQIV